MDFLTPSRHFLIVSFTTSSQLEMPVHGERQGAQTNQSELKAPRLSGLSFWDGSGHYLDQVPEYRATAKDIVKHPEGWGFKKLWKFGKVSVAEFAFHKKDDSQARTATLFVPHEDLQAHDGKNKLHYLACNPESARNPNSASDSLVRAAFWLVRRDMKKVKLDSDDGKRDCVYPSADAVPGDGSKCIMIVVRNLLC